MITAELNDTNAEVAYMTIVSRNKRRSIVLKFRFVFVYFLLRVRMHLFAISRLSVRR